MNTLETYRRTSHGEGSRMADVVLDVAVPAMAALLTMAIFLLAVS